MKFLYRDNTEAWLKFIHSSVARTHDAEHACQGDDANDDVILRIRKTVGEDRANKAIEAPQAAGRLKY